MTSIVARISLLVAALAVTAAIGASSATAQPLSNTGSSGSVAASSLSTQPKNLPPIDQSSALRLEEASAYHSTSFDWTAAGIGALAAAGACVVLFGVTIDVRRRRNPTMA